MHKRTLPLFLFVHFTVTMSAQHTYKTSLPATHTIRLNPTGLLDPVEPNLSAGYEYRFQEDWAVTADLAWIFYSRYSANTKRADGFILRSAIRRYIGPLKQAFLDAELHYKHVVSTIEDWLGRDCVNGSASYEEFTTFYYLRQSIGPNLKIGEESRISRNNKFWFEYYLGLGFRWNSQQVLNDPHACYKYANELMNQAHDSRWVSVAVPMGIRLLYRLN